MGVREMIALQVGCLRAARELQAYLDGETDPRSSRLVAAHLEQCRRCGLEASAYAAIKAAIADDGGGTATDLDPDVLARLQRFAHDLSETQDGL